MRFAGALVASGAFLGFAIAACTGGPGAIGQGGATGDQYEGIQGDTSDTVAASTSSSSSSSSSSGSAVSVPDLQASDYPQTCANDSECVAVYQGAVCGACFCPNTAIATAGKFSYASDMASRRAECPAADVECAPCATPTAKCAANKCVID